MNTQNNKIDFKEFNYFYKTFKVVCWQCTLVILVFDGAKFFRKKIYLPTKTRVANRPKV